MQKVFNVNLTGPAILIEAISHKMESLKEGIIVGISSVAGDRGRSSNYWYGSAKSGLNIFLSGLRQKLNGSGVHVITVKPGFVRTSMTENLNFPKMLISTPEKISRDIIKAITKKQNIIYTPKYWYVIMFIIRVIPEFIFKKINTL